ncbi:MAG: hypothetical protein KBF96_07095 [Ignavibacteria bacterium]|jgi:hypothetical protein|nr:hypothetical protein [Ignavibacteria bacterium]
MSNSILEPFEGISLEQWAGVNAKMASGIAIDEAIKDIGVDMPKWDRVNAEWLTRMKNDTSFTISTKYAAAFNTTATGNLGSGAGISADSIPFEKYVESMVAQDVLGKQGRDAQDVLKDFGMTVADYSNVSSYWTGKMMSDFSLAGKMAQLDAEFRKKYENMKGGDAHGDLEF